MPYKLLVVDDDRDFRNEFRDCFEGYEVVEAASANEAVSLLRKPHEIDLVFLDILLPDIRGTEALRVIRKLEPHLPIVMITGYGSKESAIEALRYHANDFIEKPLDIGKTSALIEDLLSSRNDDTDRSSWGANEKIEHVKRFVEKNCHKKVRLKDTASTILCLSPKYASRLFKKTAGITFRRFKLEQKIEKSKLLLTTTGYNINQIAEKTGYLNSESFTRMFTNTVGCSPTQYRRKRNGRRAI